MSNDFAIEYHREAFIPLNQKFFVCLGKIADELGIEIQNIIHKIMADDWSFLHIVNHRLCDHREAELLNHHLVNALLSCKRNLFNNFCWLRLFLWGFI